MLIQEGYSVRHKNPMINKGLKMMVLEISEDEKEARCACDADPDGMWFGIEELIPINSSDGEYF